MLINAKALVVVFTLAWLTFRVCRPVCLMYMTPEAFERRRNVWLTLTCVAFLSPSFWLFAAVALFVLVKVSARDDNPLAMFVFMLFTIPNLRFYMPGLGFNQFFDLTYYRILSFAILLPALMRARKISDAPLARLRLEDVLLAAFLLLQLVVMIPYEAPTNTLRRGFLMVIDTFIVFYAFSRLTDRRRLADVMASFWLACAIMAPLAVFESLKGWLLYTGLGELWGDPNLFSFLLRNDALRAQVAAGHSINLGYHLALALGIYLYVRTREVQMWTDVMIAGVMTMAIIVTYSRGAWVTASLIAFAFMALRPDAARRMVRPLAFCALALAVMYVTPLKERVLDQLPFIGTGSQDTVEYRQQLAEVSWRLIKMNPLFGDPMVLLRMEEMRQGQGIIDIVNGYVYAALFYGFVGLALVVGVFVCSLLRALYAHLRWCRDDPDLGPMGGALIACVIGSLFYIATAGYGTTMFILCALSVSYATVASRSRAATGPSASRGLSGLEPQLRP